MSSPSMGMVCSLCSSAVMVKQQFLGPWSGLQHDSKQRRLKLSTSPGTTRCAAAAAAGQQPPGADRSSLLLNAAQIRTQGARGSPDTEQWSRCAPGTACARAGEELSEEEASPRCLARLMFDKRSKKDGELSRQSTRNLGVWTLVGGIRYLHRHLPQRRCMFNKSAQLPRYFPATLCWVIV